ncbi:MAG: threonine/serine exporter family protein [Erysipelotrichaceae bacterium]|nr:threonine/serine exporter family protein [Erysipelotrichaceae bacterium]MDY5251674.1 threonine/serine exporter family protein [Erysipelotrichaceae bacterium]
MISFLAAGIASLGFGIIFNVPKSKLLGAAFCGGIGGLFYELCLSGNLSQTFSLFFASVALALTAEILARIEKCPSTIFSICALIPLVPGGGMYYTMLAIINNEFEKAILTGINTIAQACAIVIGVILISSIFHSMKKIQQIRRSNV